MTYRKARKSWLRLLAAVIFSAGGAGCASSRAATDDGDASAAARPDASDLVVTPDAGGVAGTSDASRRDGSGSVEPPASDGAQGQVPGGSARAPRVRELLDTLLEPSFNRDAETVARELCGHVFQLTETTRGGELPEGVEVTQRRVIDAQGRLRIADTKASDSGKAQRLQIDYDAQGRLERWRRGWLGTDSADVGSVVELDYRPDGGMTMEVVSTEVNATPVDTSPFAILEGSCQLWELDAQGRPLRVSFGCGDQQQQARVYHYDTQGRLSAIEGRAVVELKDRELDLRFGEPAVWRIDLGYEDDRVTTVWNETEQFDDEAPREVEQRIVRSFDAGGQLAKVEFDRGNDGSFDEEVVYAYDAQGERVRETRDFLLDGVIDFVEERSVVGDETQIERRNMTQQDDDFAYSLGYFGYEALIVQHPELIDGRQRGGPQSMSRWSLRRDDEGRLLSATLEMLAVDKDLPPPGTATVTSTLEQRYAADGTVEYARVEETQQPSGIVLEREAHCNLEPACDPADVVVVEQPSLLACQAGVLARGGVMAMPHVAEPYLPPPYTDIPSIARRNRFAVFFQPRPPTIRELVGY